MSETIAALHGEIGFLNELADRLDSWASESMKYGWSTHQVKANTKAADDCRRRAAVMARAIKNALEAT